jgi:phage tail sheath gpL-like
MTTTILQPKVNVQIVNANVAVENTAQKILFIGQKTSAGSAVAGALNESIANDGSEDSLFGRDSMLATLIRANKVRNQQVQVDAIALDDNGSTFATKIITLTSGPTTEAGSLTVIVGSERNHKFDIAISLGDTITEIALAIETAVNLDLDLPFTALAAAGVVTFTAINSGTYGNSLPLEIRGTVAGVSSAVTVGITGATDPVLTTVFDVIGEKRYQAVVWPYPNDTTELLALLDPRFNADGKVQDGVGFTAIADTVSNLKALTDALNSQSLVIFGDNLETETNYIGPAIVEIPMVVAAYWAGFRGLRLDTDGFAIADFTITNNGALDSFGGPALASKPYFNVPFANLVPMQTGRGFDDSEIEDLKDSGVSVIGNNKVDNTVISGEIVTTYKTDFAGNPDITFTFLNYVDTASQAREYFFNNLQSRFAQSRLTDGDVIKGRDQANELVIRSFCKRLYQDLSGVDFVLLESGEVALTFFDTNLIISIDKALGKVTIQMTVPIVTQLREIAATMKIAFDTQA